MSVLEIGEMLGVRWHKHRPKIVQVLVYDKEKISNHTLSYVVRSSVQDHGTAAGTRRRLKGRRLNEDGT